jgi:hypothetical protein
MKKTNPQWLMRDSNPDLECGVYISATLRLEMQGKKSTIILSQPKSDYLINFSLYIMINKVYDFHSTNS